MNTIAIFSKRAAMTLVKQRPSFAAPSARVFLSTKPLGVESPDGPADMVDNQEVVDYAAYEADYVVAKLLAAREAAAARAVGVDAPDGFADYELLDNLRWDEQVIAYAAAHEDMAKIHQRHRGKQEVLEEEARDPERW
jgi:F420-dependent methylenetetrahydromethanopterin dehydrogenase